MTANLREIASRCEAKLHAFRRTQDGVVVSFVVHPAEVPPVLALDPLGTRYMLAFVAIADDETPLPACAPQRERPAAPPSSQAGGGATSTKTPAERAVQQAGKLPRDPRFRAWASGDGIDEINEDEAAQFIRDECCGGNSRKLIAEVPEYMDRFMEMLTAFQIDVGELPEPR